VHKHHNHCEHEVEYCKRCDKPYCTKCGQEWELSCAKAHYPYAQLYWTTDTFKFTNPEPYRITIGGAGDYATGALTCSYAGEING
jgi:hypothetical protein